MWLYVVNCTFQMPPKVKSGGKGRAPPKRKLPEEFPPGEVLTDTVKRCWKLGRPVGQGGFGLLYLGNWEVPQLFCSLTVLLWQEGDVCIHRIALKQLLFLFPAEENSARSVGADARYVIKVVRRLRSWCTPIHILFFLWKIMCLLFYSNVVF